MFETHILNRPSCLVSGVSIRTSYDSAMLDIPKLWGRVMSHDLFQLTCKPQPIYAIYTEYESDYLGAYTMMLAIESREQMPVQDRVLLTLAPGKYTCFKVDGDPTQVIKNAWNFIHREWPLRAQRMYQTDFEIHGVRGPNTADIYVGIR